MESQTTATLVVREADPSNGRTEDAAKVVVDPAATKAPQAEPKTALRSDAVNKKAAGGKTGKSKPAKNKNSKKRVPAEETDSSDSDDDNSDASSSSGTSTGSELSDSESSDSEKENTRKSRAKKRRDAEKAKKKMRPRKSKKPIKTQEFSESGSESDSESSSSDSSSDSDNSSSGSESGSGAHSRHRRKGGRHQQQHQHRQRQLQKRQQEVTNLLLQQQQHSQIQLPPQNHMPYQQPLAAPMYYGAPFGVPFGAAPMGNPLGYAPAYLQTPPPPPPPMSRGRGGLGRRPPPGRRSLSPLGRNTLVRGRINNAGELIDGKERHRRMSKHRRSKGSIMDFKRVDQVWDSTIHNYKLQDTAEKVVDAEYEGYLFHVRRTFDWEGKYKHTIVDIKSKLLREVLQAVIGDVKGVSLVEETPKLDPNLLFLYVEDMRDYVKALKKAKPSGDKKARKKEQKRNEKKRRQLKVLVKYIDKDYEAVKKSLNPMLENGIITFDLLWALWKPNTLAFSTAYGSPDQPRVFKAEMSEKHFSIMKGDFYYIEGKYFEYDGKRFGFGSVADEIGGFRGARKITSLPVYPLKYHKNEAQLRQELIDRGKKFVALSGVQYKSYDGMAYYKKKKETIKVNISGRVMVDASIHRRINPNYPISVIRPKDHDLVSDDDSDGGYGRAYSSDSDVENKNGRILEEKKAEYGADAAGESKADDIKDPEDADKVLDKDGDSTESKTAGDVSVAEDETDDKKPLEFTDEEYLIASPVVLGFAFAEKLWLELTVSNVNEIQWNENAYQSLVLEAKTKDIVKALVESHKYHAAESIDDVIQGKGKGLVAVLHGPPGTGKTLTAEGISELLKCPLYMVSAGELGTDSRYLESELQKILDICHAWGAILLLDEADVFLEKRNMHDIHRNALVSIFLRQLEYFQGILFLTTNRVETFDDAFQSRIHIALRYDSLDHRAKKAIFKIFIERVRVLEKIDLMPFSEEDFNALARHDLNGRQIKNTVRTAQALAVNKGEPLCMSHIRQVLDVQMSFDRDLKGGPGFQDAMRSYF
ncbi:aaa family ATPase [Niveomyces insectorum RCEF 264]|uniref:Aaa family ATPase n=1 Tax=Niveomyces insectorum RCEF 264 TaxID=1081102 RepID=A0A167Z5B1_9HYPO|nr:aaa family ATPase [Niveomyces insectorum RCEF 264]